MGSCFRPRPRRTAGRETAALAAILAIGAPPLHPQEGGLVAELCPSGPFCSDDGLEVVFDSGSSTYAGPLEVGTEIPVRIVVDTRSSGMNGFSYAVANDPDILSLVPESLTTAGTIFDPETPGNIGPAYYLVAKPAPGGFMAAAILPLAEGREMPPGRNVVSRAAYQVAGKPECSVIRIVHNRIGSAGGIISVAVVASVGGYSKTPRTLRQGLVGSGPCKETCDDLADNDGDGLLDCHDPDCLGGEPCGGEVCNDALDNDRDGKIDCGDPDCAGLLDCPELAGCGDGVDNDMDGLLDCADPDCAGKVPCFEQCEDGIDNDGDSLADCSDPDCLAIRPCPEDCDDGIDNDADGFVDRQDMDCANRSPLVQGDSPAIRSFVRGDTNGDGRINVLDALALLRFVSGEEQGQDCMEALNTNGDGGVDASDALPLLRWIFLHGPALPPPFPQCGRILDGACNQEGPGC